MPHGTLLAVDLSYQTYRAASSHQQLTSSDGEFTGGLYGFLVTLSYIIKNTEATHVVVCQDRKPYKRSDLYPAYKMIRKSTSDPKLREMVEVSKPQIASALEVIGIPLVGVDGYESDDLVGHYTERYRHRFKRCVAASNDSDLFQLFDVNPRFSIYRKDDTDIITRESLKRDTGLEPSEYMLATALMGTHNDVEGIPRVGEKTAIRAVKDPGLLRTYQERHANLIARNLRLIKLPYEGFPADLELPSMGRFRKRELYRFAAKYDINVTTSMLDAFEQVCP